MSLQQILPYIGGMISVGGLIFKMGEHAEKIHVLTGTVEAQEKKVEINHNIINEIHNDLGILKNLMGKFWIMEKEDLLKQFDTKAVGTYAPESREKLSDEMESDIARVIESCRLRWKDKIRERLKKLEKRALREATQVVDLIQLFENDVQEGEEEFWYPEAFPCLIHAVESFTMRLEKKVVELQRQVNSSDLEMGKVKAESEALVKSAQEAMEKATEEKKMIQENLLIF